ncbi:MFS general substrate transporter [Phlegmacium glaucopus]|nr:MFS general substrate transporter [Phlegmacium glaucopus]
MGCIAGSLLGGRWSDRELRRLRNANGGKSYPEMRLRSTILSTFLLPPCVVAFGWVCKKHVHVSAICVFLFLCGFFSIWSYSSTLAYIVDANQGRSSTAVAANSAFRGVAAFLATELAVPMQDGLGDGWLYTIWSSVMLMSGLLTLLVWWKGGRWREEAEAREAEHEKRLELRSSTVPEL